MASDTLDDKFLSLTPRALIISVVLHLLAPVLLLTTDQFQFSKFKTLKKKTEEEIYQSYVQVDVVALPEQVGLIDKFVDPSLPVVDKSKAPVVPETPAAEPEAGAKDAMELPDAAEEAKKAAEAKKAELEKKAAEAKEKKEAAARKAAEEKKAALAKKEAERKSREADAKRAMEDLKARMERERAIKNLSGKEGREAISGNIASKGTSTRGKTGDGAVQERYIALVKAAIKANFNVFEWLKSKTLKADVRIEISSTGAIVSRELVKSSGNARYDSAVLQSIDDTKQLPPPPEGTQIAAEGGATIGFTP